MSNSKKEFISIGDVPDLYKNHLREILTFVFSFVHNEDDAKEITHDAFCNLLREVKIKKIENTNSRAYLFKIARNLCIDNLRKNKVNTTHLKDNIEKSSPLDSIEDKIVDSMLIDSLQEYINTSLSETESSVFKLKFYYKLGLKEISYIVNSSISSVSRMIKKIIDQLEKEFPDIF